MNNDVKIMLVCAFITLVLLVGGVFFYTSSYSSSAKPVDTALLIKDDSFKIATGSAAKVTMVEFGDFQCPACGVFHPTLKAFLSNHQNEVVYYFRNFPLVQHKNAEAAANAFESAVAAGKGREMMDELYTKQKDWEESTTPLEFFLKYADEIKVDKQKMKKDVESAAYKDKILRDVTDGNRAGVDSTPTLFLNGIKYSGSVSSDALEKAFAQSLKTAK